MLIQFNQTVLIIFFCWIIGLALFYLPEKIIKQKFIAQIGLISGILICLGYIINLWIYLEREPLRTLGETRLWYSFFISAIGMVIYYRWHLRWIILYSFLMSILFLVINLLHPENFDKTLMPALRSYWFVPHVIVYIFAYSLLAATALMALKVFFTKLKIEQNIELLNITDNIVYAGFSFLTLGLLFGALWAKQAWGSYWTWDPKETWAFLTWLLYLIYIHFRYKYSQHISASLLILACAFGILLICWFGINYLPATQNSVHTY